MVFILSDIYSISQLSDTTGIMSYSVYNISSSIVESGIFYRISPSSDLGLTSCITSSVNDVCYSSNKDVLGELPPKCTDVTSQTETTVNVCLADAEELISLNIDGN